MERICLLVNNRYEDSLLSVGNETVVRKLDIVFLTSR